MTHNKTTLEVPTTNEKGQGLVEYVLILILVCVVAGGLIWGGKSLWDKWQAGRNNGDSQTAATEAPIISGEGEIVSIAQTGSTVEVIEPETATTNNCYNSNPTELESQRSRSVEHLVIISKPFEGI